jgi:hypothetical protein
MDAKVRILPGGPRFRHTPIRNEETQNSKSKVGKRYSQLKIFVQLDNSILT